MIPRYSRPQLVAIWEPENRFKIWLEIELLACEGSAKLGEIPAEVPPRIRQKAGFDIARIDEIEREVKHDVIAFLTSVSEQVGEEARYLHKGMTSSDVLDTCLAVQLVQATDILLKDIDALLTAIKTQAMTHKHTIQMGRSHGIHAEPISFGLTLAIWYDEIKRHQVRLLEARKTIAIGKISGAVGTFAHIDPRIETYVCDKLGLSPAPASSQIIQRDRHAAYFTALALLASSIEKIAVEIRHLQRTEVYEAEEYFSTGQKGSSAMPHKRNPVVSENLTGLARLVRSYSIAAMENVALWHQRDISHSSVERVIGPDATILTDFMLSRLTTLIGNLQIYPDRMQDNIDRMGGLHNSQRVLLALTERGVSRDAAYRIVQRNAMKVWEEKADFLTELKKDAEVTAVLATDALHSLFDDRFYLRHIDTIFTRVFTDPS